MSLTSLIAIRLPTESGYGQGCSRILATAVMILFAAGAAAQPLLGFPIKGQNPYTAPITTVLDHSGTDFYVPTHTGVLAYTGELALGRPGGNPPYGYFSLASNPARSIPFVVNGA